MRGSHRIEHIQPAGTVAGVNHPDLAAGRIDSRIHVHRKRIPVRVNRDGPGIELSCIGIRREHEGPIAAADNPGVSMTQPTLQPVNKIPAP